MAEYTIEVSVNTLKERNITEIDTIIHHIAGKYNCSDIYVFSEEDGTRKIPQYHIIYTITFLQQEFTNCVSFIKFVKTYKPVNIESIYHNKLVYASPVYVLTIAKDSFIKYKQFIKNQVFTTEEQNILRIIYPKKRAQSLL